MAIFCKNCGQKITNGKLCNQCQFSSGNETHNPTVGDVISLSTRASNEIFFNISAKRLFLLSLVTCGFYDLYWFYKNWRYIETELHKKISPLARTIFSPIFCFSLFSEVANMSKSFGYKIFPPGFLAFFYFLFAVFSRGLNRIDYDSIGESDIWILLSISFIIIFLSALVLFIIQKAINFINEKKGIPVNKSYTTGEVTFIIIGLFIIVVYFFI